MSLPLFRLSGEKHLYLVVFTAYILYFLSGTTLGWTSPVVAKLEDYNSTSDYPFERQAKDSEITWIAAIIYLGSIIGTILISCAPDILGRKNLILLLNMFNLLGYVILTFADDVLFYIAGRFILGIGLGAFYSTKPHFMNEICHQKNRGFFVSVGFVILNLGHLFALSIGPYISIMSFNFILLVVSFIFIPMFYLVAPESPYYLLIKDKEAEALASLTTIRNSPIDDLRQELEDMKLNVRKGKETYVCSSILHVFEKPVPRRALLMLAGLIMLHQLTGVPTLMTYAESFFEQSESKVRSDICPIIVMSLQFFASFIIPITCDRFGRKVLVTFSSAGTALSLAVLGSYFYLSDGDYDMDGLRWMPLVCFIAAIIFYNLGLGILPFVIATEILPMEIKFVGAMLLLVIYSSENFLLTKFYKILATTFSMSSVLWSFTTINCLIGLYTYLFVIETKGKTLNEIQEELRMKTVKNKKSENPTNTF